MLSYLLLGLQSFFHSLVMPQQSFPGLFMMGSFSMSKMSVTFSHRGRYDSSSTPGNIACVISRNCAIASLFFLLRLLLLLQRCSTSPLGLQ